LFKFRIYRTKKQPEESDGEYDYHIRQIFLGHHSIVTLAGFTVGGILIGRSLYELLVPAVGLMGTIAVGLLLFAATGLYIGSFRG
jgi:hypothetical protein